MTTPRIGSLWVINDNSCIALWDDELTIGGLTHWLDPGASFTVIGLYPTKRNYLSAKVLTYSGVVGWVKVDHFSMGASRTGNASSRLTRGGSTVTRRETILKT